VNTAGQVIRSARLAKGISQTRLGELVGVTQPTVSKWESGGTIVLADLAAIITVLDLSWSDFDTEQVAS
jgi:transcriptional regulator with XRE-family HTH domain